jgi:hypothetical protein
MALRGPFVSGSPLRRPFIRFPPMQSVPTAGRIRKWHWNSITAAHWPPRFQTTGSAAVELAIRNSGNRRRLTFRNGSRRTYTVRAVDAEVQIGAAGAAPSIGPSFPLRPRPSATRPEHSRERPGRACPGLQDLDRGDVRQNRNIAAPWFQPPAQTPPSRIKFSMPYQLPILLYGLLLPGLEVMKPLETGVVWPQAERDRSAKPMSKNTSRFISNS